MDNRPILFLDFDGVLHPAMSAPDVRLCHLPMLAEWLMNEAAGVDVVISSDWRLDHGLDALRGFFPEVLRSRICGALPREEEVDPEPWGDLPYEAPRQCLIMAWLNINRAGSDASWAALDDWREGFRRDEPRLVEVPGEFGLQRVHLDQVARILGIMLPACTSSQAVGFESGAASMSSSPSTRPGDFIVPDH